MTDTKSILWRVRQVAEIAKLPDTGNPDKDEHRAAAREATIGAVPVLVDLVEQVQMIPDVATGNARYQNGYRAALRDVQRVIEKSLAPLAARQRKDKRDG